MYKLVSFSLILVILARTCEVTIEDSPWVCPSAQRLLDFMEPFQSFFTSECVSLPALSSSTLISRECSLLKFGGRKNSAQRINCR